MRKNTISDKSQIADLTTLLFFANLRIKEGFCHKRNGDLTGNCWLSISLFCYSQLYLFDLLIKL